MDKAKKLSKKKLNNGGNPDLMASLISDSGSSDDGRRGLLGNWQYSHRISDPGLQRSRTSLSIWVDCNKQTKPIASMLV
jgi:hypothetical protein